MDALAQLGHGLKQHLLEIVEGVIHLIQHRGFELVQFIGAPPQPDLLFQLQAQALGLNLPYQLLLALPYVVAVLAMMLGRANSRAPTALGIPYQRP
jgi:hypothetical protein